MATFNHEHDRRRPRASFACYVKGAAPAVAGARRRRALSGAASVPWDDDLKQQRRRARDPDGGPRACG